MKAKEIIRILDDFAKPSLIDCWDNTGFQIGDDELEVEKIIVALDLDQKLLDKAISEGCQMIITHHPIIFKPLKTINNQTYIGRLIYRLILNNIVAYNAHSNLDLTVGGVNDVLASCLGIEYTEPLNRLIIEDKLYGYGRIGKINPIQTIDLLDIIKDKLEVDDLRVYGNVDKRISTIAVCGGSGGDFILDAYTKGADIYITGDIKYHEAQLALQVGLILVDAGHFHTEKMILAKIKDILLEKTEAQISIMLHKETGVDYKIY